MVNVLEKSDRAKAAVCIAIAALPDNRVTLFVEERVGKDLAIKAMYEAIAMLKGEKTTNAGLIIQG